MTAALDQAVWPEDSGSGESDNSCYAGILGKCRNCSSDGCCACGIHLNGKSDFVVMDRSEWDEPTLLCPNYEPLLIAFNAAVCLSAALVLMRVIRAFRFQASQVRAQTSHPKAPMLVLSTIFTGTSSILLYSALKLGLPDRVVGIDLLISLTIVLRELAGSVGFEAHLMHVVNVALNSQVWSWGEQRVLDAKTRQLRHGIIKATMFSIFGLLPVIQSICALAGLATSLATQTALTLAWIMCKVSISALAAIVLRSETRSLLTSFSTSIEAAQAGFIIASGGEAQESLAARLRDGTVPEQSFQQRAENVFSAHLQALLNELANLEDAYENVRCSARAVLRSLVFSGCFWLMVALVPRLWNKTSSVFPILALVRLYSARAVVVLHSSKRTPWIASTTHRV